MISRLSTLAASFAILATASLACATSPHPASAIAHAAPKAVRVVQLDTVVITAKRLAPAPR